MGPTIAYIRQPWNLTMPTRLVSFLTICLLLPLVAVAQEATKNPSLEKLHQAIAEIVSKHYPESTSHLFEQTIGFEHATRVYVTRLAAKYPPGVKPPVAPERGPLANGVWGQVWYRDGDMNDQPAYQRSEGVMQREFFKEHRYYANDAQKQGHLIVTLRLPLETTPKHRQFVTELRALLNQFGKYVPAPEG